MFNSVVVEVAVGLALVFFLVATVAAGVNQVLSRWADVRAKTLWRSLENLLTPTPTNGVNLGVLASLRLGGSRSSSANDSRPRTDPSAPKTAEATQLLLETPSIRSLDPVVDPGKPTKIENIPPRVFAMALLELAKVKGSNDGDSIAEKLKHLAQSYPGTPIAFFLESIAAPVGNDLDRYLDAVGGWFDDQMTRLSDIYRRNVRWVLLAIGLAACVAFNIDALEVGRTLRDDANLRAGVLVLSENVSDGDIAGCATTDPPETQLQCARNLLDDLNGLKLPVVGDWDADEWKRAWTGRPLEHGLGILLSAGAVSLGAPFWFDALRSLSGVRRRTKY